MAMEGHEESDQLPEEGPGGQVPDDDGQSNTQTGESPGARDEADDDDQATGNPDAAGEGDSEESNSE